jgi:transcriptional regulator with XRE-family HTH domain
MPSTVLKELANKVGIFISHHDAYVSRLERSIKDGEEFAHKTCHECNFGVEWDSMVVPVKSELPEEVRALVEEIEKIHCEFHEVSMHIDPKNPQPSDEEKLNRMREMSNILLRKLFALKRLLSKRLVKEE